MPRRRFGIVMKRVCVVLLFLVFHFCLLFVVLSHLNFDSSPKRIRHICIESISVDRELNRGLHSSLYRMNKSR